MKFRILTVLGGFFLAVAPAFTHHSFMAEFDQTKKVTLDGTVTKVEWQNPHTYFLVAVKDANGKTATWRLETGSPSALIVRGWTRETMKAGDHIVVHGYLSKETPNVAAARSVTMADGKTYFGGQTDDGGPTQ